MNSCETFIVQQQGLFTKLGDYSYIILQNAWTSTLQCGFIADLMFFFYLVVFKEPIQYDYAIITIIAIIIL